MNDPRITSYALGELEGKAREEFERDLAASDDLQKQLNETIDLAKDLGALPMPAEKLEPETRSALLNECAKNQTRRRKGKILRFVVPLSLAAAACLLLLPVIFGSRQAPFCGGDYILSGQNTYTGTTVVASGNMITHSAGWADGRSRQLGWNDTDSLEQIRAWDDDRNTEGYNAIKENPFLEAQQNPLSTFSIDVDTASYSNVRRFLRDGTMPPVGAIRTEELINYFTYNYPQPTDTAPFSVNLEVAAAPWDAKRELVRIGLKGKDLPTTERTAANLVFLVDVSSSMQESNKLPLLQRSLRALVENLSDNDRVAIVVYAGSSGLVLPSTPGTKKQDIISALDNLSAGGSTHGSEGIKLAYETARENFRKEGTNRVILCTDGDFNVGVTDQSELQKLIEKERASGVFLSVLGFGTGNVKDSTMELLADKGNGNYAYIDTLNEGRKVLVEQMSSTLFTIAKDVKIQVEFNPARVAGYRLIGYENRLLAKEDFNDDKKDAGEIGAGHTVTALYEIIPAGEKVPGDTSVDPLKYQKPEPAASGAPVSGDLLTVKLRYKQPDGDKSQLIEFPLPAPEQVPTFDQASTDFRFAAAVAAFGMKLRGSPDAGNISWTEILKIARGALSDDPGSYRAEFLTLVEAAKKLVSASVPSAENRRE